MKRITLVGIACNDSGIHAEAPKVAKQNTYLGTKTVIRNVPSGSDFLELARLTVHRRGLFLA